MTKKRRMFDIEMPDDAPETFPAGKADAPPAPSPAPRRGPMATAIGEAAHHNAERHAVEAQIRKENDDLAHEYVRLRDMGLVIQPIPLADVEATKLLRDRTHAFDPELSELKTSIMAVGLSNPIRAEWRADGKVELIQGYRRLSAYRELLEETGDHEKYGAIPAVVAGQGDGVEVLYRRMVDENLVRKDISFAEMARLAIGYTAFEPALENDTDKAVALLFKSAGYQKRSYIRSFIKLMEYLDKDLRFPQLIPRALGLALVAKIGAEENFIGTLQRALAALGDDRSAQAELDCLRAASRTGEGQGASTPAAPKAGAVQGRAKTSFQFDRREGRVKCTAANGKLELRLNRDFSTIDRRQLERAVIAMLDGLE